MIDTNFSSAVPGRARLLVDLDRLTANFCLLRDRLARHGTEPMAVVKAGAYGHGAIPVATALWSAGCRRFAVSSLEEGLALRAALPAAYILVLGYVPPAAAPYAAEAELSLAVFSLAYAKTLSQHLGDRTLSVELKLNSGMNRLGLPLTPDRFEETLTSALAIAADPRLRPRGVFSHLASADRPGDGATALAVSRFRAAVGALFRRGLPLPAHLAASAAVLGGIGEGFPFARLGLALYGYAGTADAAPSGLLPVARLEADIASVFTVARGETVGYGGSFRARRREVIGILPLGYADGLLRSAEGALVRVGGRLCPLVGRISMDAAAVLLTGVPRRRATVATVFGDEPNDLYRLAEAAGTIPYELLAGLGPRIDRKYSYGKDPGTCDTE